MSTTAAMICTRCNKPTNDIDKCSTCGSRLKTMQSQTRRGWLALGGGAFLVVFMGAIWIWVDGLLASSSVQHDLATDEFIGRINVAFGLVVVAGVLGVINGWLMAHSGRRNNWIVIGLVIVFVSALFVACSATSNYRPT
jgi:MFS family permease